MNKKYKLNLNNQFIIDEYHSGKSIDIIANNLKCGRTTIRTRLKDNGIVLHGPKKHGLSTTQLYRVWAGIKDRCYNKNHESYHNYGGRGITMCNEWLDYPENFIKWMIMNKWENGLEVDRIDNNKEYSPNNCRITTRKINTNNKRNNHYLTFNNKTQTVMEWSEELSINYRTILSRINRGLSIKEALSTN